MAEVDVPAFASARIMSAPFSPIMIVAALVLPDTTAGMIEASITLSKRRVGKILFDFTHALRCPRHRRNGAAPGWDWAELGLGLDRTTLTIRQAPGDVAR